MSTNPKGIPLLDVGRDVQGRFRPGNRGGPGNPFARKVASLRKTLLDAVSEQDLKDVTEILKLKARQGDTAAIKLLLQYCVGKPEPAKDPDRMDADEWGRLQEMRVGQKQLWRAMEDVPASLACHVAATAWPCTAQEGPLAETIGYIHAQMRAGQPSTEPGSPGTPAAPPIPRPDAAPAQPAPASADQTAEPHTQPEPAAPAAPPRPAPAEGESESAGPRARTRRKRRERRSPTRPPSPNGGNEAEQQRTLEQLQRLYQPPEPPGQAERQPPPG